MIHTDINLLPKPLRVARLRRIYWSRVGKLLNRIYVLLVIIIILQIVIWLAFNSIFRSLQLASDQGGATESNVVGQVAEINRLLVGVDGAAKELAPWTLQVDEMLELVPSGMQVTNVKVAKDTDIIVVSGAATAQEVQVDFKQRVEQLSWVQRVDAPLENFAVGPEAGWSFSIYRQ